MYARLRIGIPAIAALALAILLPAGAAAQDAARGYAFTPVLHSVSYAGVWRGQAQLTLDQFLVKAKELGFTNVEVMGKRPHLSPLDYDAAARAKLKARLQELGIRIVCLAGYPDFTASADKTGHPERRDGGHLRRRTRAPGEGPGHPAASASSPATSATAFPSTRSGRLSSRD